MTVTTCDLCSLPFAPHSIGRPINEFPDPTLAFFPENHPLASHRLSVSIHLKAAPPDSRSHPSAWRSLDLCPKCTQILLRSLLHRPQM